MISYVFSVIDYITAHPSIAARNCDNLGCRDFIGRNVRKSFGNRVYASVGEKEAHHFGGFSAVRRLYRLIIYKRA